MIWKETENSWLNSHQRHIMNFRSELDSCAASASPLTGKELESIGKHLETIGRIINRHAPKRKKK